MLTVVLAILAAAVNAGSSVLQRVANRREASSQDTGVAALVHLLRRPVWLAGIAAVIVSFVLQAAALSVGDVSEVQPLMALELPITLLLAARVFHRRLSGPDRAAVAAMAGGMSALLFALQPSAGHPGRVTALDWVLGTGLPALVVLALGVTGHLLGSAHGAALLGIASGICFALTAIFMSAALAGGIGWSTFTRWQTYLVAVAGLGAMLLLQLAQQAGTLVAVQPGVTLTDPVVAIIVGVAVLGEQVRAGGWIALQIAGVCAVGWGTVVLSRSEVASDSGQSGGEPGQESEQVNGRCRNSQQPDG